MQDAANSKSINHQKIHDMKVLKKQNQAAELYATRQQCIKHQIKALQEALKNHSKQAKADPGNWGNVGDLGMVIQNLSELDGFMKSTKPVIIEKTTQK